MRSENTPNLEWKCLCECSLFKLRGGLVFLTVVCDTFYIPPFEEIKNCKYHWFYSCFNESICILMSNFFGHPSEEIKHSQYCSMHKIWYVASKNSWKDLLHGLQHTGLISWHFISILNSFSFQTYGYLEHKIICT